MRTAILKTAGVERGKPGPAPSGRILIRVNTGPFASMDEAADAEAVVDWRGDEPAARACTLAYAATELRRHLREVGRVAGAGLRVAFAKGAAAPSSGLELVLAVCDELVGTPWARLAEGREFAGPESFLVHAGEHAGRRMVLIAAPSRQGVLYGVYRYLEWVGFRWVHKDEPLGTLEYGGRLWSEDLCIAEGPAFAVRGLLAEGARDRQLAVWGARNRFNLLESRPEDGAFLKKLGYTVFAGGHVMEVVFDPERPNADGRLLFDEHPEWFALRDGKRLRRKGYICLADPQAVRCMLDGLLNAVRDKALAMPLDAYKFWGADTWGAWCECAHCRALGNSTDRYLGLVAGLRQRMDALQEGVIDGRRITLFAAAYEGSYTLEPPTRPLPDGFDIDRIIIEYFPINRCYQHTLFDPACRELNHQYAWALEAWLKGPMGRRLVVGEYYNVSQYIDLALGFSRVMDADLTQYRRRGVLGVHYMHVPCAAWGPRTLTQFQFGRQLWNPALDRAAILAEYLGRRYGAQAPAARRLHALIESRMAAVTSLCSWSSASLAATLRRLLGAPTLHAMIYDNLFPMDHFKLRRGDLADAPPSGTVSSLDEMESGMRRALALVERMAANASDRRVRQNLEEDRFLIHYTHRVVDLFRQLALLWRALKYGGPTRTRYANIDRISAELAAVELPAGSCWKTSSPALARVPIKVALDNIQAQRALIEALSRGNGVGRAAKRDQG